jgi:ABC-2 type transport system ATP-binding protein
VRRDILVAVVRTVADEGRTVLFSSHLLDELERVADHVAMIDQGRIVFCGEMAEVQEAHRRLTLRFPEPRARPPALAGVLAWEGAGYEWTALYRGRAARVEEAVAQWGALVVEEGIPSLHEIFVAQAGTKAPAAVEG